MKTPLWSPSEEWIKKANVSRFIDYVNGKHGHKLKTFADLYQWSIESTPDFWARMWEFAEIKASRGYDRVVDDARLIGVRRLSRVRCLDEERECRRRLSDLQVTDTARRPR